VKKSTKLHKREKKKRKSGIFAISNIFRKDNYSRAIISVEFYAQFKKKQSTTFNFQKGK